MPDLRAVARALQGPRFAAGAALVTLTTLAWLRLSDATASGPSRHAVHALSGVLHSTPAVWHLADLLTALTMWLVMAVAMMLPTALPAVLAYADVTARAGRGAAPRVGLFVAAYLLVWALFGVGAALAQWGLAAVARDVMAHRVSAPRLGAGFVLAAGLYQFSPFKDACLSQCRSPLTFFLAHWRDGWRGALALGLRHGLHCVGCCWMLMALMLPAGAMNLAWTAVLSVLMLAEKVLPAGRTVARVAGVGLLLWGASLLLLSTD